jgi:hypothetical protein
MDNSRDEIEAAFDKAMNAALTGGENAVHSPRSERVANIVRAACAMCEDGEARLLACWDKPTKQLVAYTLTTIHPDKNGRRNSLCGDDETNVRIDAFKCMDYDDLRYCTDAALIKQVLLCLPDEWTDGPEFLEKAD